MSHLAHKLPWQTLAQGLTQTDTDRWKGNADKILYFANAFADVAMEFAATATAISTGLYLKQEIDLDKWDNCGYPPEGASGGGHLPIYSSLMCGYIRLNLAIIDEKFLPREDNGVMMCCRGSNDGGHPYWIASKVRSIIQAKTHTIIKPLTREVVQQINEICRHYFEVMYRFFKKQKFTKETIVEHIQYQISLMFSL